MYHPDLIRVITGGANQMPCVKFPGYLYNSLTLLGGILNQGSRPHASFGWGQGPSQSSTAKHVTQWQERRKLEINRISSH